MFKNVEAKLKRFAAILVVLAIIAAVVTIVLSFDTNEDTMMILIGSAVVLVIASLIGGWFIYAFAEMLEYIKKIEGQLENIENAMNK